MNAKKIICVDLRESPCCSCYGAMHLFIKEHIYAILSTAKPF